MKIPSYITSFSLLFSAFSLFYFIHSNKNSSSLSHALDKQKYELNLKEYNQQVEANLSIEQNKLAENKLHQNTTQLNRLESWADLSKDMSSQSVLLLLGNPNDIFSQIVTHMSGEVTVRKTHYSYNDGGSVYFISNKLVDWDQPKTTIDTAGILEDQ